jgi:hypothetical protein
MNNQTLINPINDLNILLNNITSNDDNIYIKTVYDYFTKLSHDNIDISLIRDSQDNTCI